MKFLVVFTVLFFSLTSFSKPKINGYIVKLKENKKLASLQNTSLLQKTKKISVINERLRLYHVKPAASRLNAAVLASLKENKSVELVQPNHILKLRKAKRPNDSEFAKQWSFNRVLNQGGVAAMQAWNLGQGGKDQLGNEVVVGVVDGGFQIDHPDLAENLWVNASEIANNKIDDDKNGYIDDVNGINAADRSGALPSNAHGTHVAGIMGAHGNNGKGVTGINWKVKIMMASMQDAYDTAQIMRAYGYMYEQKRLFIETKGAKGANVVAINSSFGIDQANCESGDFVLWNRMFDDLGSVGILSVGATANMDWDIDKVGDVPTGCSSEFVVAVTNTTKTNQLNDSAGYGRRTIDLGAPGTDIYSTITVNSYDEMTGTSMATPHVTGAIGFLHSVGSAAFAELHQKDPQQAARVIKDILLQSVLKISALAGKTVSGGKLNLLEAAKAVQNYQ